MKRATWNGVVVAESDDIVVVEGNAYFPEGSLRKEFVRPSQTHTSCAWKGTASYFDLIVNGKVNEDAVWFYATPSSEAAQIQGRVAFWKGVAVTDV